MIPLRIRALAPEAAAPFVVRIGSRSDQDGPSARIVADSGDKIDMETPAGPLQLSGINRRDCVGDILLVVPKSKIAHRLIRAGSPHNTFLVTEQCDQECIMCSQPPKKHHLDLFPHFETAARLAPEGMVIGISGGEPTLHKERLFDFLRRTLERRPDLSFHVLTNAQHFEDSDKPTLRLEAFRRVTWGIPLYATDPIRHDEIVKKPGAFERLMTSFNILAHSASSVELRTVLLQNNAANLAKLATFIATMLPFASRWAIMQLENIGYARMQWNEIFYDNSADFDPVAPALDIAKARGIDVRLYNFPLCSVPEPYRLMADCSISDWKRRYLPACGSCSEKANCTGFFEWYPDKSGFRNIRPL